MFESKAIRYLHSDARTWTKAHPLYKTHSYVYDVEKSIDVQRRKAFIALYRTYRLEHVHGKTGTTSARKGKGDNETRENLLPLFSAPELCEAH